MGVTLSANVRLLLSALLTFLISFLTWLNSSSTWDDAAIRSAIVAGIAGALQVLTPLNPDVTVRSLTGPKETRDAS